MTIEISQKIEDEGIENNPENLSELLQKSERAERSMILGDIHFSKGRYLAALRNYRKATAIFPDYTDAYNAMVDALRMMGSEKKFQNPEGKKEIQLIMNSIIEDGVNNGAYDPVALNIHTSSSLPFKNTNKPKVI